MPFPSVTVVAAPFVHVITTVPLLLLGDAESGS